MDPYEQMIADMPISAHIGKINKEIAHYRGSIAEQIELMGNMEKDIQEKGEVRAEEASDMLQNLEKGIDRLKQMFVKSMAFEREAINNLQSEIKKITKDHLKLQQQEIVVQKEIKKLEIQAGFKQLREHYNKSSTDL